jgi:hypothetical protein
LTAILAFGCATFAPPPPDRFSPEEMKKGPSLYETGHIATVPPSSNGLKVDEGAIDRPAAARPLPAPIAEHPHGKRKVRARASQAR